MNIEFNDFNHFVRVSTGSLEQVNKRTTLLALYYDGRLVTDLTEIDEDNKVKFGRNVLLGRVDNTTAFSRSRVEELAEQFAGIAAPFLGKAINFDNGNTLFLPPVSSQRLAQTILPHLKALLVDFLTNV